MPFGIPGEIAKKLMLLEQHLRPSAFSPAKAKPVVWGIFPDDAQTITSHHRLPRFSG
jgi:hypothetical protein